MARRVAIGLALVLGIGAPSSCAPETGTCGPSEVCVRGNVRRAACPFSFESGSAEADEPCGERTCVENTRSNGEIYAACAIGEPDLRCDRDEDTAFCDGETWVRCHGRYREEEVDCTASGHVCDTFEGASMCVLSHDPDPECVGARDSRSVHCDGEQLVFCFGPLAAGVEDCSADGRLCRRVRDGVSCVLGPGPDPRCETGTQQYCDGDDAVLCAGDFRLETLRCDEEERRCVEAEPGVRVRCE